ncbi:MAG: hypothetical protein ABII01_07295 [Candidatus Woesearchaeota archaeon]
MKIVLNTNDIVYSAEQDFERILDRIRIPFASAREELAYAS